MEYKPVNDERVIHFSQGLPDGWWVVQLDSGHYMATDNINTDSVITVNRWQARRWAFQLAAEGAPNEPKERK